ncbi:hypothetical protein JQ627_01785 [Bradyrhizobium liaoningense]|nr:hypothetical protein [Bradyrhizobium liaoningense]
MLHQPDNLDAHNQLGILLGEYGEFRRVLLRKPGFEVRYR